MSAQRDLFSTQMQLEDQLIDQRSPMTAPKAQVKKGWDQEPTILSHDSVGWHCYTCFRLNGIAMIGVQTGPQGGSCKSSWCEYDEVDITGRHEPIGYMLGHEAKATKTTTQEAHKLALKRMEQLRPDIFPDMSRVKYRIQHADGTIKNAGTDEPSWFTLKTAREQVNYGKGERIVEHDGMSILWETL